MNQEDLYWFTFILVTLVGFFTYKLLTRHLAYFRWLGVPHERPHLLYGNLSDVLSGKLTTMEQIQQFSVKFAHCDVFGFYNYMSPALYIRDSTAIRQVLRNDSAGHFESYGYFLDGEKDHFLGSQLHLLKGAGASKKLLPILAPVLRSATVCDGMEVVVKNCGNDLVDFIVSRGNEQLELKSILRKHTMNVHAGCTFGKQLNTFDESTTDSFLTVANGLAYGTNPVQTVKTMVFYLVPQLMRACGVQLMDRRGVDLLLKQYQAAISSNSSSTIARLLTHSNAKAKQQDQLNEEQLTAQCVTFFTKGLEPVVTLLSFALYELARADAVQQTLFREIESASADGKELSFESIRKLPFLEAVVQETLRKWPPQPLLVRECTKPYLLAAPSGGARPAIPLKVGDKLYVSVWTLHRNAEYFPEPERFNPERFLGPSRESIMSGEMYIPFGVRRGCVGQEFVTMMVKATLVTLVTRFRLSPGDRTVEPLKLIESPESLEPRDGLWINFNVRHP
ncbi:cytochrome P450 9c1-like [Anopheles cruzii]|uniref:cytochrome P450 9c1-like n=1 Tax=Anopheles cruzii TaxID=68878 RepID=UPI0022EC9455|nr:cytochrome P450 9c1-like [Anopheles cruzii]